MSYRDQPGDKRGRWTKSGGLLGAGLLAGLVAFAAGGDIVSSVGAGLDTATGSEGSSAVKARRGQQEARQGHDAEALGRLGLKEIKRDSRRELRCAVQSHGRVQQYFLQHPCDSLDQLLFAASDARGNVLVGSVVWVKMPSNTTAAQLKRIEDTFGSGDVTPFGTEVLGLGGIRFTGTHYRARLDGPLVVIAETEPVRGRPPEVLLNEVAAVTDVLPPL
ncbi:hypothetical protein LWP59_32610 [Amycolatopsis acidiphila]|uniref:Uncharacterized protein n=1 Tax=Amycolatopsis acidiphila TaxID=715473 RepID=A0A558AE91_9PSEU|nr:hypothetical protein [Amycolatopsis acidiphila]TVT22579.1 hypothetical protein FNH06_13250 [Amycolatopsis acidiphila]UIJ58783.1 hypothetical protein LWP59_32610 [Amycolatopsis acidiphila]GHG71934.1 hypothetical protein GCM10017788_34030 [Amycolatopsis acidiphila]